jgi:predicted transcriptional regulator
MTEIKDDRTSRYEILRMASDVVSAYVGKNPLPPSQISEVIQMVYCTLSSLDGGVVEGKIESQKPAVNPKKSIFPDYVVCLEDGKKLKMLKRHLRTTYGLTPDEYRVKWGLPPDYPMVAPNYAAQRSDFAKKIGLGRKSGARKGRR